MMMKSKSRGDRWTSRRNLPSDVMSAGFTPLFSCELQTVFNFL